MEARRQTSTRTTDRSTEMKSKHQAAIVTAIIAAITADEIENVCDLAEAMRGIEVEDGDITGENARILIAATCDILAAEDYLALTRASEAMDHVNEMRGLIADVVNACEDGDQRSRLYPFVRDVIDSLSTGEACPGWMEAFSAESGLVSDVAENLSSAAGIELDIHGIFDDGIIVSGIFLWPEVIGPKHNWPFEDGQDPFSITAVIAAATDIDHLCGILNGASSSALALVDFSGLPVWDEEEWGDGDTAEIWSYQMVDGEWNVLVDSNSGAGYMVNTLEDHSWCPPPREY